MRALLVLLTILSTAAPAVASETLTIDIDDTGRIVDRSTVHIGASVWCEAIETQTSGELRITLTQATGPRAVTGTGVTPIACDGTTRHYTVVVSTAGHWHRGSAVAEAVGRAEGYREMTMCIENPDGEQECETFTLQQRNEGSATETVTLLR